MGIETVIFATLMGVSAISKLSNANSAAKDITKNASAEALAKTTEGNLLMKEKAKQVRYAAAKQTNSFLNSGLTLEGTPGDVLNETFATGQEDIAQIGMNYKTGISNIIRQGNSQAKQTVSAARSQVISDIASGFAGAGMGSGMSGMFDAGQGAVGNMFNSAYFGKLSSPSNLNRYLTSTGDL